MIWGMATRGGKRMATPDKPEADDPHAAAERLHAHRLTLFSVSSGMIGVCLTAVGLIGVLKSLQDAETMVDELLTFAALVFLTATGLYFWLLRRRRLARRWVDHVADITFFIGLALLLVACALFTMAFRVSVPTGS
jgi:hypothetical protein